MFILVVTCIRTHSYDTILLHCLHTHLLMVWGFSHLLDTVNASQESVLVPAIISFECVFRKKLLGHMSISFSVFLGNPSFIENRRPWFKGSFSMTISVLVLGDSVTVLGPGLSIP